MRFVPGSYTKYKWKSLRVDVVLSCRRYNCSPVLITATFNVTLRRVMLKFQVEVWMMIHVLSNGGENKCSVLAKRMRTALSLQ